MQTADRRRGIAAEMTDDEVEAWVGWAQMRGLVLLADGRVGRLFWFKQGGGRHKVFVQGAHITVPNDALVKAIDEAQGVA